MGGWEVRKSKERLCPYRLGTALGWFVHNLRAIDQIVEDKIFIQ